MKQKVVIKVPVNGSKSRIKALKIAVGIQGVESASLQGEDKSQIVVEGEGIDSITLAVSLRKSLGSAELVSVSEVKEKKEEKTNTSQSTTAATVQPVDWFLSYNQAAYVCCHYIGLGDRVDLILDHLQRLEKKSKQLQVWVASAESSPGETLSLLKEK
ncbi:PREDICTED: uncharacterized protein LOC104593713 [Nelumbo nucifera]|uniref:Uncharacterized protein LOC104593713 n=1 Tax=Nelumbo nucifera TaxID=4432 RepID=A0A1U7ZK11_NELNU|nr:PREDICTED: uncharacterized protein LOC104593713 [Nelumbo nucifera]